MPTLGYLSILIFWTLASSLAVGLSVLLTNPLTIGPVGVTIWFLVFYGALAGALTLALYGLKTFIKIQFTPQKRLSNSWRQGIILSSWVTIVLGLSSLGQLALRDAILLGLLLLIIEVYIRLRRA